MTGMQEAEAAVVEESPRIFGPAYRALSFGVVISVSLVAFEAMSVATILPVTARELGGLGGYGWAFSAFMLANLVGTIAAGQLADERGPTRPLVLSLLSFAAGLGVAGLATTWPLLIAARVLQGFGGGAVMTLAYLAIRSGYPESLRARMLAIISSSWILPSLLGPAIAGAVAQHSSWRWVFLGLLPLPALTAALMLPALRRIPVTPRATTTKRPLLFSLQLALGAGLSLFALELRGQATLPLFALGMALVVVALARLLPKGTLLAKPGLPAGLAFRGLLSFVFFGAEAFVPLGLSTLRGLSPTQGGLVLTGASLSWVVGSWMQARMDARPGSSRKLRLVAGLSLVVFGVAGMALAAITPFVPVGVSVAAWALGGLGMGLAYPTSSVIVLSLAEAGQEGRTSSSLNLVESLGIAFGAGICGAAFDFARHAGWSSERSLGFTFALATAPSVIGMLTAMRAGKTRAG